MQTRNRTAALATKKVLKAKTQPKNRIQKVKRTITTSTTVVAAPSVDDHPLDKVPQARTPLINAPETPINSRIIEGPHARNIDLPYLPRTDICPSFRTARDLSKARVRPLGLS